MTARTGPGAAAWAGFAAVLVLVTALTGVVAVREIRAQQRGSAPSAATELDRALDLGAVLDRPHIVFRSSAPGPTYGLVAAVPLDRPTGERSVTAMSCDRIHAVPAAAVCLAAERGAVTRYRADLLTGRLQPRAPLALAGIPSRARLSSDGSWVATTTFVTGHSYGAIGFSTETTIAATADGRSLGNLEKTFVTRIDGRVVVEPDLNLWGVTFAPGPRPSTFYLTVATGGTTWLARGDLVSRTVTALRKDAECPSLSPDGHRLVYKKRAGSRSRWRYHVLDLRTGSERPLTEKRSIDDQVEWLDDQRVIYGVPRGHSGQIDVWTADVRTTAAPRLFLPNASSPAVVRAEVAGR